MTANNSTRWSARATASTRLNSFTKTGRKTACPVSTAFVEGGRSCLLKKLACLVLSLSFTLIQANCGTLLFLWDRSPGAVIYRLYRITDNSTSLTSTVTNGTATVETDTTVQSKWFVKAINTQGSESLPSMVFTYIPGQPPTNLAPTAPTNLGLQLVGPKRLDLVWSSDPTAVTEVERSENGSVFVRVAETAPGTMHWSDNGIWKKNRYAYRLRSRNANGLSPYSITVTFSPQ